MRDFWKMTYFTAESGYSAARRMQRRLAASAAPEASPVARVATLPVAPLSPHRRFAFSR